MSQLTRSLTVVVVPTSSYAKDLLSEIVVLALGSAEQLQVTVCCFEQIHSHRLITTGTAGCQAAFGTCTSTDLSPDGTCKLTTPVFLVVAANAYHQAEEQTSTNARAPVTETAAHRRDTAALQLRTVSVTSYRYRPEC
jgi:hypothetical protein